MKTDFTECMAGGAFVFRADQGHELLYANENLIRMFECGSYEEFLDFVGGSFDGIAGESRADQILKDIEQQMAETQSHSGYVFFNIRTKENNVRRIVNHWTLTTDEEEGDVFYAYMFFHKLDNTGRDFDSVTALPGKAKFHQHVSKACKKAESKDAEEYAIIYLNLVNFKLLNIERGVSEGDECLRVLADTLRSVYRDAYIARISGDHFAVFSRYEGLLEKTEEAERIFCETYGNHFDVIGKFGIYKFRFRPDFDVESALSQAKVACDHIKYNPETDIVEYSESLVREIRTREYVVGRIDEAIEKGWIRIYYQPVIRSLTGALCGMESLVRWIDPNVGFLRPDQFISILEEERCIHKLDSYVVEQVCRCIRKRVKKKLPMVPVSVNFSRLDFVMCDMLGVVERAIEKYEIPRDYIHIEITESMIASDEELMRNVIESFRKKGYEIWMDDFGSGYSSLTLLKDYRFDTLKLDMSFLTPFTETSKSLVRSTVNTAKDIMMRSLAEGVETKEQLDFLKEIGCGMIQGYYYGKPEPIEDVFEHLKEKGVPVEFRRWRHFYDVAGFNVRHLDTPLEIIEDDGENFRTLFMNRRYREQVFEREEDRQLELDEIDRKIYRTGSPLLHKYREFADIIEESGKTETFYYTVNGNYFCFRGKALVENEGHYIIKGNLVNITHDEISNERELLNAKLRELNLLFEDVLLVKLKENELSPLLGSFRYVDSGGRAIVDLQFSIWYLVKKRVFPEDQERCEEFLRSATIKERVEKTGKGYIEDVIRVLQPDGSYQWNEIYLIMIPGTGGNEYLYCMKSFTEKAQRGPERNSVLVQNPEASGRNETEAAFNSLIIENLRQNSNIKFFFKDTERRFTGVSQSFLEYFGMSSEKEVLGKTDEEMHWHVEDETMARNESEILENGKRITNASGKCIAGGVVRNIVYHKMPLYENGRIAGLAGCFLDRDEELGKLQQQLLPVRIDPATGIMNSHAFVDSVIDYAEEYRNKQKDYCLIVLNNLSHQRILSTYGEKFGNRVLKEIADRLLSITGNTAALARMKSSVFAVLMRTGSENEAEELKKKIKTELDGITEVNGNSVTMRVKISMKIRSGQNISDEEIYEKALKEVS